MLPGVVGIGFAKQRPRQRPRLQGGVPLARSPAQSSAQVSGLICSGGLPQHDLLRRPANNWAQGDGPSAHSLAQPALSSGLISIAGCGVGSSTQSGTQVALKGREILGPLPLQEPQAQASAAVVALKASRTLRMQRLRASEGGGLAGIEGGSAFPRGRPSIVNFGSPLSSSLAERGGGSDSSAVEVLTGSTMMQGNGLVSDLTHQYADGLECQAAAIAPPVIDPETLWGLLGDHKEMEVEMAGMIESVVQHLRLLFEEADAEQSGVLGFGTMLEIFRRAGSAAAVKAEQLVPQTDPVRTCGAPFETFLRLGISIALAFHVPTIPIGEEALQLELQETKRRRQMLRLQGRRRSQQELQKKQQAKDLPGLHLRRASVLVRRQHQGFGAVPPRRASAEQRERQQQRAEESKSQAQALLAKMSSCCGQTLGMQTRRDRRHAEQPSMPFCDEKLDRAER